MLSKPERRQLLDEWDFCMKLLRVEKLPDRKAAKEEEGIYNTFYLFIHTHNTQTQAETKQILLYHGEIVTWVRK